MTCLKFISTFIMPDEADTCITELAIDKNDQERPAWNFFGQKVSRTLCVFLTQTLAAYFLIIFAAINLSLAKTCEDTTLWLALLAGSAGYILPSPRL